MENGMHFFEQNEIALEEFPARVSETGMKLLLLHDPWTLPEGNGLLDPQINAFSPVSGFVAGYR